jgi:hypothetical protein
MPRSANRHQEKSGKPAPKGERGLRQSLVLACDLFLIKCGLKDRGSFRFGGKR